jgi:hypothetical protein
MYLDNLIVSLLYFKYISRTTFQTVIANLCEVLISEYSIHFAKSNTFKFINKL